MTKCGSNCMMDKSCARAINGDFGWLMYLRGNGDPGFSSRNPNYDGPPDAQIDYELSNGQRDLYPASWRCQWRMSVKR